MLCATGDAIVTRHRSLPKSSRSLVAGASLLALRRTNEVTTAHPRPTTVGRGCQSAEVLDASYPVLKRKFCGARGGAAGSAPLAGSSSRANASSHASIRVRPTASTTSCGLDGTVSARGFTAIMGNPSADVPAPALSPGEFGTLPVRPLISLMSRSSTASRSVAVRLRSS